MVRKGPSVSSDANHAAGGEFYLSVPIWPRAERSCGRDRASSRPTGRGARLSSGTVPSSAIFESLGCPRGDTEPVSHLDQLRQRGGLHLLHDVRAMELDR